MANRFVLNETSYHGAGAIKEIVTEVNRRGYKKAFVCSDPDLVKFNVTKKVTDLLEQATLEYELYSDIKPNPTIENALTYLKDLKNCEAHATYIITNGDKKSLNNLGIRLTCEPNFHSDNLFYN